MTKEKKQYIAIYRLDLIENTGSNDANDLNRPMMNREEWEKCVLEQRRESNRTDNMIQHESKVKQWSAVKRISAYHFWRKKES